MATIKNYHFKYNWNAAHVGPQHGHKVRAKSRVEEIVLRQIAVAACLCVIALPCTAQDFPTAICPKGKRLPLTSLEKRTGERCGDAKRPGATPVR